jgi:anti-anti-sigma factor
MKRPISITRALGSVVVTVHGDVDTDLLRRTLTDLAETQGNLHLVIDLRDAESLDPSGVAVLVDSSQRVRQHGWDLVLSSPPEAIQQALEGRGRTITGPYNRRRRVSSSRG